MECKICRSLITSFLNNDLEDKDRMNVINHISECSSCNEELKLHYFVGEGLKRLEDGGNLNLESEFQTMIINERDREESILSARRILSIILAAGGVFVLYVLIKSLFILG